MVGLWHYDHEGVKGNWTEIRKAGAKNGKEKRGAHDEQYLQPPDRKWLERLQMLFAAHPEKVVLISDSILVAGMQQGKYISGGMQVTLQNGKALLGDGTIAGSAISLFDSMVMAIRCGVLPEQAVCSATCVAADSIGLKDAGSIAIGKQAELLMVNKAWNLEKVLT